jgi:integrase
MDIKGIRPTHRGWEVSVSHQGNRKTAVCKTKAEAKARRAELLNQLLLQHATSARVGVTVPSTITLKEAADRSLADRWAHIKSKDAVWSYLKQVLDFLGRDTLLSAIDKDDLLAMQNYFISTGNRAGTVNKKLAIVRSIFTDAIEDELVDRAPKFPKKLGSKALKDRVFSKEEEQAFIAYFRQYPGREEGADIFCFLLDSCARWGEINRLKTWDVDLQAARVTFEDRKANNLGSVPLTKRAQQIAAKYQHRRGQMFEVSYDTFNRWFNEGKALLGITDPRLTIHCTRHTCATRLAEANVSLAQIMTFGGWSSLKSVKRYLHVQTDALLSCVSALEA